ncbi:hypothetical protein HYR69_06570 [Candidatus Sumerlaeota bacterium]|nr:hypothetical protein [Candidatus Sumerlaeota bacterium]
MPPKEYDLSLWLHLSWSFGTYFTLLLSSILLLGIGGLVIGIPFGLVGIREPWFGISADWVVMVCSGIFFYFAAGIGPIFSACILGCDGGLRLTAYLKNSVEQPWGDELHLTSLAETDLDLPTLVWILRHEWWISFLAFGAAVLAACCAMAQDLHGGSSELRAFVSSPIFPFAGVAGIVLASLDILMWVGLKQAFIVSGVSAAIRRFGLEFQKSLRHRYLHFLIFGATSWLLGFLVLAALWSLPIVPANAKNYLKGMDDLIALSSLALIASAVLHCIVLPVQWMKMKSLYRRSHGNVGAAIRALRALK